MRSPNKARRRPLQARAQETIQCIIEATAKVLIERGYAGASTNHIAEKAGISVGSFYQYFSDKDEAIQALLTQHLAKGKGVLLRALAVADKSSLAEVVEQAVAGTFVFFRDNFALCEVLHNELPKDPRFQALADHYEQCASLIEGFLRQHAEKVRPENRALAAAMIVHAIVGVFFGLDPALKKQETVFLRELQSLVGAYLLREPRRA